MTKKRIIGLVVGVIAILFIGGLVVYPQIQNSRYNDAVAKADSLMKSEQYNEALKLYDKALTIKNNEDAKKQINQINKLLKGSKDNFKNGMASFNNGLYKNAYDLFSLVIKDDSKNYKVAAEKMKECIKLNTELALKNSMDFEKAGNYSVAVDSIRTALVIDKDNQQLKDALDKYNRLRGERPQLAEHQKLIDFFAKQGVTIPGNSSEWDCSTTSSPQSFGAPASWGNNPTIFVTQLGKKDGIIVEMGVRYLYCPSINKGAKVITDSNNYSQIEKEYN